MYLMQQYEELNEGGKLGCSSIHTVMSPFSMNFMHAPTSLLRPLAVRSLLS